jgi:hypothetical protein
MRRPLRYRVARTWDACEADAVGEWNDEALHRRGDSRPRHDAEG